MMHRDNYDDYIGHHNADDDFDFPESPSTPAASHAGFRENAAVLNINIGTAMTPSSRNTILKTLEEWLGQVPIKIQLKSYSDIVRSAISEAREKLVEDDAIDVETDEEDERDDDDDFSDTRSVFSSVSNRSAKPSSTRLVEFAKTSDLVIIYAWKEVADQIRNFAYSRHVTFSFTTKGYLLKGENEETLDAVEKMIRDTYNSLLPFKEFEGQSIAKINTIAHALRNIKEKLVRQYKLKFAYTMTSDIYYKAYQDLAKKVPALAQKFAKKTNKPNLRVVLHQNNIRNQPDIVNKFRASFFENSTPFTMTFKLEGSEAISPKEIKFIIRFASQEKLCATYDFKKIIDDKTLKILTAHEITLMSYYSNEFEKKTIIKKSQIVKEKITRMIRPPCFYYLSNPADRAKFFTFVLPEIQQELKERRVYTTLVKKDDTFNPRNRNKGTTQKLALSIEGEKQNTKFIQQKIGQLIQQVRSTAYNIKINDQHAHSILTALAKPENEFFFNYYFQEIYNICPEVKMRKTIERKNVNNNQNAHRGNNNQFGPKSAHNKAVPQDPQGNDGTPQGGQQGKPYGKQQNYQGARGNDNKPQGGWNKQNYNNSNNNNQQQQQQQAQQGPEELIIEILYKNKDDYERIKVELDRVFPNLTSKMIFLNCRLADLLARADTTIDGFKSQNVVLVSEWIDFHTKKPKTALIGDKDNVENAFNLIQNLNNESKPVTERVQIDNQLIINSLKADFKKLSTPGVSWKFFRYFVTLLGEAAKIQTTKTNIEKYIVTKKTEIKESKIEDMPSSHLKAIEEKKKWYFDLQFKNQVKINLIKPTSSKLNMKIGLQNQAATPKSLILVHGDITKIQADAIVNSTNLKFGDATIIQGVAKAIMDKAGEEYVEECQAHGELAETKVFVSGSGNLGNCKSIINVCPPIYKSDSDLNQAILKLKNSIVNILMESARSGFTSIAIPFLSAGNYGIPPQEAINCIIEELAKGLFGSNMRLERIMICEIDETKQKIAEQKIKSIVPSENADIYVVKNQWQYLEDGAIWTNYDLDQNRTIDYAFSQGNKELDIKFPVTRAVGSHIIDIKKGLLVRKSTGSRSQIERKPDGWYENGQKMSDGISEIIDLKQQQGSQVFEIFLNEYNINFTSMLQLNKQTLFTRKIQKTPLVVKQAVTKFTIPNVSLMQPSSLRQGKMYGQAIIQGFSQENTVKVKKEIEEFIEGLKIKIEVEINSRIDEETLQYMANEITKHKVKYTGELKPGKKVILDGIKPVILKLQNHIRTVNQVAGQAQSLPRNWAKMNDDDNCVLVPLLPQDEEWGPIAKRFSLTMPANKIKNIQRIQNAKFWRDYCSEKENLGKLHEKAGFGKDIKEEYLWHGTRGSHPHIIYGGMDECFDMQHANEGMWGRGLYFAVNASYSHDYAHPSQSGTKLFMLCRVLIGDAIQLPSNSSIRKPPERTDGKEKILYDSIKGYTGGSDVYILYRMRRAYPEYLIEY